MGVFTRKEERKALVDSVKGVRSRVRVDDGINADIGIASASVYPQGVGALLHQYSLQGPEGRNKPVGVIDVGYKTVDYLLVLPGANGVVVPDTVRSGSVTMGMGHAIDQVREYVRSETGVSSLPPEGLVQTAVRGDGVLSVRGGSINIRDAYESACKSLALAITSEIERVWKEQMDYLAAIYLTGGGGADLAPHLQMPGVRVMDEPVFANALGFLSIAMATGNRA